MHGFLICQFIFPYPRRDIQASSLFKDAQGLKKAILSAVNGFNPNMYVSKVKNFTTATYICGRFGYLFSRIVILISLYNKNLEIRHNSFKQEINKPCDGGVLAPPLAKLLIGTKPWLFHCRLPREMSDPAGYSQYPAPTAQALPLTDHNSPAGPTTEPIGLEPVPPLRPRDESQCRPSDAVSVTSRTTGWVSVPHSGITFVFKTL